MQKLIFGLIMASRKMRHYLQAHEITVVTRFPLQRILRNPEATGGIVEWALELSSFGLKYESTSTIQSRALGEFIAEWTPTPIEEVLETVTPQQGSAPRMDHVFRWCLLPTRCRGWRVSRCSNRGALEVRPDALLWLPGPEKPERPVF